MVIGNPLTTFAIAYNKEIGLSSVIREGSSFNGPKGVAIAPSGESYVTDGYGNARRHRFTPDGD